MPEWGLSGRGQMGRGAVAELLVGFARSGHGFCLVLWARRMCCAELVAGTLHRLLAASSRPARASVDARVAGLADLAMIVVTCASRAIWMPCFGGDQMPLQEIASLPNVRPRQRGKRSTR